MVKQSGDKISQLLKKHKGFTQTQTGKIHCQLTNHQMSNVKEFKEYLKGRAYKRALESNFDINDYSEHLLPYHRDNRFLFCKMTGSKVVNKKSVIQKHINGKKYKRTLERVTQQLLNQQQKQQKKLNKQQINQQQGGQIDEVQEEEPKAIHPKSSKKVVKKIKKISKPAKKPTKTDTQQ